MKRVYISLLFSFIAIFSGCGGDGDGKFDTGNDGIIVTDCDTYTDIKSGDLLVKDSDNTIVKIINDSNGAKRVCVKKGSAHIVREGD